MKILSKISIYFIYVVSIFGAIDIITDGIKPTPNTILFIYALLAFGTQFYYKKRLLVIDIMILIFALISSLGFSLFISDLLFQPIAIADDCEGHKPSRTHYFDIMLVGISITFILCLIFLKTHKQKLLSDQVLSFIFIVTIILCFSQLGLFRSLHEKINDVSKPSYTLPAGC